MKLKLFKNDGSANGETEVDGLPVFEGDKGVQAVKEVVVAQAANARQGSANTKTRGEVRGGGKKPWRQKGTGRARAGSTRSPIWVGGGIVFGPRPRDYSKKINKKVKTLAFGRALFDRIADESIVVVDALDISPAKTKVGEALVRGIAPSGKVLVIDKELSETSVLALRNLAGVDLEEAPLVSVTDLCQFKTIIVTRAGLEVLVERAKGGSK
ncbi:50S ribosomal protein L4 [Pelagicoccus sp. SDUM812005]|uniref:50S ribosomal protein L4 n=1 Tax=Pelagicoccus sp. SDUM812005 TaxID=3041257 RepID=UPI002810819E|nr:50S ribosomal protein L4 [Pelagicoccus sp. SDUM812005]MDQ8183048.1 50S ribosomal protein L4 [Pelagicoccus sp. SDUM812005]